MANPDDVLDVQPLAAFLHRKPELAPGMEVITRDSTGEWCIAQRGESGRQYDVYWLLEIMDAKAEFFRVEHNTSQSVLAATFESSAQAQRFLVAVLESVRSYLPPSKALVVCKRLAKQFGKQVWCDRGR